MPQRLVHQGREAIMRTVVFVVRIARVQVRHIPGNVGHRQDGDLFDVPRLRVNQLTRDIVPPIAAVRDVLTAMGYHEFLGWNKGFIVQRLLFPPRFLGIHHGDVEVASAIGRDPMLTQGFMPSDTIL